MLPATMRNLSNTMESPARQAEPISLASTDWTGACRFIYVGTAGNIKLELLLDTAPHTRAFDVGYHYLAVKKIYKTGTTAGSIVAYS